MNVPFLFLWQSFRQNPWTANLLGPAIVFFVLFLLRGPVSEGLARLIVRASEKAGGRWGRWIDGAFRRPLRVLIAGAGVYAALRCVPVFAAGRPVMDGCFRSFLAIVLAWGLYRMADPRAVALNALPEEKPDTPGTPLLPVVAGVSRFLIVALAVLIVAQEWNYSISGLLAGLGLGGLAFALAAKDMLANLFGGVVILLDKPFTLGDWIRTGDVEGIVESVNFRSVKIRTADQALVTVPNANVTAGPVANFSRTGRRRLEFTLGPEPGAPAERVKGLSEQILRFLERDPEIEDAACTAALESAGSGAPALLVSCFVKTADRAAFLKAKERICYAVMGFLHPEQGGAPLPGETSGEGRE